MPTEKKPQLYCAECHNELLLGGYCATCGFCPSLQDTYLSTTEDEARDALRSARKDIADCLGALAAFDKHLGAALAIEPTPEPQGCSRCEELKDGIAGAYQACGAISELGANVELLDNLSALASSRPLPHPWPLKVADATPPPAVLAAADALAEEIENADFSYGYNCLDVTPIMEAYGAYRAARSNGGKAE